MRKNRTVFEALAILGLSLAWAIPLLDWSALPEHVPMHFGPNGKPDGWGPKSSIFILAGSALFVWVLMTFAARRTEKFRLPSGLSPEERPPQVELAQDLLAAVKAEVALIVAYLTWCVRETAFGRMEGLGALFAPIVLFVLFGTIALYFMRSRSLRRGSRQ